MFVNPFQHLLSPYNIIHSTLPDATEGGASEKTSETPPLQVFLLYKIGWNLRYNNSRFYRI